MTIGIDASRSVSAIQKTGVEKVSDELLKQFIEVKSQKSKVKSNDFDFIFYTPQEISWLPKENQRILKWPFKFFWTQIRLAFELIIHPPEVMFFPVHAMPLLLLVQRWLSPTTPASPSRDSATPPRAGGEKMRIYKIIHDIAFKKQPQLYSFKQRIILNLDLWLAKKLCAKIFVPSTAVKNDLIKYAQINSEKIVVTPWGYNSKNFQFPISSEGIPMDSSESRRDNFQINSKYQIPNPKINENNYGLRKKQILYIGRVEEKKNIGNLIKAFEIFHEKYPNYKLILAGKITDYRLQITDYKNIEFLGYISEEKKHQLLAESAALAHIPKEEGFCFPMLEAFDFGLPVVASDIPVLREIGGDACVYVNPDSPEAIAKGLEIAVETRRGVSLQIGNGRERLKEFDWQKTAEIILGEIFGR